VTFPLALLLAALSEESPFDGGKGYVRARLESGEAWESSAPAPTPLPDAAAATWDSRYLPGIRSGDEPAFAQLYEESLAPLWAFAMRYVREDAIARDVIQDVFYSLWVNRNTLHIETTLRAYLFGAVRYRSLALSARDKRRAVLVEQTEGPSGAMVAEASPNPDERIESSEVRRTVAAAVSTLPERQQLAITLRIVQSMTYEEIGSVLGISKVAVSKLVHKAQDRLRKALAHLLI
jgi:RNA polymerase sigma-70 factor (ECF subfamily)